MARKHRAREQFGAGGMPEGQMPEGQASQRRLRIGEEVRHALAKILREDECRDPALEEVSVTVTEVRMSPDLRNATAFVMPLAGANAEEVLAGLKRCATFLKGRIAREVRLRNTPSLVFALDDTFDRAERISALLARPEVARDLQEQAAGAKGGGDGD
jgi:ribosome-binding factor A